MSSNLETLRLILLSRPVRFYEIAIHQHASCGKSFVRASVHFRDGLLAA